MIVNVSMASRRSRQRLMPVLAALLIWGNFNSARAASVPETSSSQPPATPASAPRSGVIIDEAGARKSSSGSSGSSESWEKPQGGARSPPGSPVKLFMPDEFQFYTLNNNGQLVMKQMTKQEIQGMIAAGSAGNSQVPVDLGHHQLHNHMTDGVPKVSDVVQNVQKVLKGELSKPVPTYTSGTSIPGSVNSQWTNMLPYILSGGSVDQHDIQDSSIIMSDSDAEPAYVDVVPLHNVKPGHYEPETNYVQVPPEEIKLVTIKTTSNKPISLFGNMALGSEILDEQEAYTMPPKSNKPTTVTYKFSTKPPAPTKGDKPTPYKPSTINETPIKETYGYSKNKTKPLPASTIEEQPEEESSAEEGYVRIPLLPVSSTEQTASFETPSTISIITTTTKDAYPSKINIGPIGGFKKPDYRPSISYRPIYEPIKKFGTTGPPTYRPVYEVSKPRPVYDPRPSTQKVSSTTYQYPVYQQSTKPTTASTGRPSSSFRPTYEEDPKPSFPNPESIQSIYEILTKPNEGMIVTRYPIETFSTGKASSPMMEFVTQQPSTQSELLKVTKYPSSPYTTGKSTPVTEIVVKSSTQSSEPEVTSSVQSSKNQQKDSTPSYTNQQVKKKPSVPLPVSHVKVKLGTTEATAHKDANKTPEKISNESKHASATVTSMIKNFTASSAEKLTTQSIKMPNATKNNPTSSLSLASTEESSTDKNDYHSFMTQEDTTLLAQTESTPIKLQEMANETKSTTKVDLLNASTEKSTLKPLLEMTTQEIPIGEGTTEYINLEDTKKADKETSLPTEKVSSIEEKETTYAPFYDKTDSSFEYTTLLAIMIGEDDSEKSSSDIKIATPTNVEIKDVTKESYASTEIEKKMDKKPTSENKIVTPIKEEMKETTLINKEQTVTEKNKLNKDQTSFSNIKIIPYSSQLADLIKDQNKSDIPSYENKIMDLLGNYQSKLTPGSSEKEVPALSALKEKTKEDTESSSSTDQTTLLYEKTESVTENIPAEKIKTQLLDNEISTVKVIPIYDDDASMYTSPPFDGSSKSTTPSESKTQSASTTMKYSEATASDSSISSKTTESMKSSSQEDDSTTPISTSTPSYTVQKDPTGDLLLPGLQETFNNYMKEHYDPSLSTTDNYDEISGLTTFPPVIYKGLSMNKNKVTESALFEDYTVTDSGLDEDSTITENLDDLKLDYTTENPSIKELDQDITEIPEIKETVAPVKSELNETTRLETPIYYLDLTSPDPIRQSSLVNEQISNSSLTRIKVKNPVLDIDKIISAAQAQTMTASTESYTLPDEAKSANNIASGLIAGYPTSDQEKSETDSNSTKQTNKNEMPIKKLEPQIFEDSSQKTKLDSLEEKLTTLAIQNEKFEPTTAFGIEDEETSTYDYHTSEIPSFEFKTQLPPVSDPIENKSDPSSHNEEKYDPPLEKISDLISQLQNSPSNRNQIAYDSSNGIATTIVPLENFKLIVNETNSLSNDQELTTLFDSITKTPLESKNSTFVVLQTLPTTMPYETTTRFSFPSSTTEKRITTEPSTPSAPKKESTTVLSVIKQSVTGKPFISTTYSTTKGYLEKIQSTIDKSAGRINLEEEKAKLPTLKPTEPPKFTMKSKGHYNNAKRPTNEGYLSYTRKATRPPLKATTPTSTSTTTPSAVPITTAKFVEELKVTTEKLTTLPQKIILEPELNKLLASSKEGGQILGSSNDPEPEIKKLPVNSKEGVQHLNPQIVSLDHSSGAIGLDQSTNGLDKDVAEFLNMCNELSFRFWTYANSGLSSSRSVTLSPFGMISTLAMIFLGARGLTSNQMNDILKLDDVVTFNPHLVFQNITDTVTLARGQGIENAAFVRALFADRLKVRRIIPFYKEQAQQFYEGAVVDINFSTAGDILRRRTNLLIRKQTGGRIKDFMKTQTVPLRSPLTALSANVFQTSCDSPDASSEGRDGEMYFAVSQTVKQRKLVPIPAVVWKSGVSAGYEPSLDATAVALGDPKRPVAFIMIMPGQQGLTAPGDNLERLENRLFGNPSDNPLDKLLKVIIPRRVEVQMPKFSHRSVVNITSALKKMGFEQLFMKNADLKGINGAGHDLYLADMLQMNLFCTCGGENKLGGRPLSETYPGTVSRHTRAWETINNFSNKDHIDNNHSEISSLSESSKCDEEDDWSSSEPIAEAGGDEVLNQQLFGKEDSDRFNPSKKLNRSKRRRCRTRRQAEPEKPRMKMDKPFLYLIRHNLTGLILHIGRFNPKNQS